MRRKAFDVDLVDEELFELEIGRCRPLPVEPIVDDDALRDDGGVVAAILNALTGTGLRIVGEQQVVGVAELPGHGLRVGIEKQFGVVESQAPFRAVLTANLVAVQLSGVDAFYECVPHEPVALLQTNDVRGIAVSLVEEEQEHVRGVLGVQREVDAGRRRRRAQWVMRARGDGLRSPMLELVRHDGPPSGLKICNCASAGRILKMYSNGGSRARKK